MDSLNLTEHLRATNETEDLAEEIDPSPVVPGESIG